MTSIRQLNAQKVTVLRGIADKKNSISSLEEKISRLQTAATRLTASISALESTQQAIENLTVDLGRWRGEEKSEFEENYSDYQESTRAYLSKTENAKDAIDQDIKRYEAQMATSTTSLMNLESSLASIEWQIRQADMEGVR
ncbi:MULTISPECIES: DUF5082 family protein [Allobacillus]|uniref:DUF5082 domain-containing protein n=1 Tax=Allobacillus salarius TaxID=1955272 RepID=A0A556PKS2_9BACI|nr:DUF5082 family protein [Allobacillus salarius]TSJ64966.1 DUF5082 domain-containing protein [Allobacillus salarius]